MTSLSDLQQACERYRLARERKARFPLVVRTIADALTDATPISKEKLEEIGFHYGGRAWGGSFMLEGVELHLEDGGVDVYDRKGNVCNPRPQTMGDLYALLLRLGREQK